jgi:hypothetical protein
LALGVVPRAFGIATPASAGDPNPDTSVIECRSGLVTDADISMSASVTRVSAALLPTDTPGDCSRR